MRAETRFRNGTYEVHGVAVKSESELIELGNKLIEYRAYITVKTVREAVAE